VMIVLCDTFFFFINCMFSLGRGGGGVKEREGEGGERKRKPTDSK